MPSTMYMRRIALCVPLCAFCGCAICSTPSDPGDKRLLLPLVTNSCLLVRDVNSEITDDSMRGFSMYRLCVKGRAIKALRNGKPFWEVRRHSEILGIDRTLSVGITCDLELFEFDWSTGAIVRSIPDFDKVLGLYAKIVGLLCKGDREKVEYLVDKKVAVVEHWDVFKEGPLNIRRFQWELGGNPSLKTMAVQNIGVSKKKVWLRLRFAAFAFERQPSGQWQLTDADMRIQ